MYAVSSPFDRMPFLWGSAIAAYQCEGAWNEGGKGLSEWDYFNALDWMNVNGADGRVASDFYHRFEEDLDLIAEGGQNALRLSLCWSRILPDGTGRPNEEGLSYYDRLINGCLSRNIEPNVVLLHYDLPYPIAMAGGWSNAYTADAFREYARICFERFGDRVKLWSTLDEPQFYSYNANIAGLYPPCRKADVHSYLQWQYNEMLASAKAVALYHEMNLPGAIGVVHNGSLIEVAAGTDNPHEVYAAADFFNNRMVLCPALEGRLPPELNEMREKLGTFLYRVPDEKEIFAAGKGDYLNLNVYARRHVSNWNGSPTCAKVDPVGGGVTMEGQIVAPLYETLIDTTVPHNQWGREILPRIMHDSLVDIMEQYGNPVVLTENGHGSLETPDENGYVEDNDRIKVIEAFLESLSEAQREGSNVRGYYIWSAMDLYSWVNGYKKRYGLVRVDFDHSLTRIPKKSWAWYRDFISRDAARRTDA